ncbi:MAG: ATP-binding protein [Proteobacteria bacterium]|nr:ATP-binding protein [Pseudomonadota bacterium]
MVARGPRLSIPTRVFLGFALVLTVSGAVLVASILQHQRTAATLRLLHGGYLPLALTVGEARATQAVFGTLLDRLPERDWIATQRWIDTARRVRPATIRRALDEIVHIYRLDPPAAEQRTLERLQAEITSVERAYGEGDTGFDELFRALAAQDKERAHGLLVHLRAREQSSARQLREVWSTIQTQVEATGLAVSRQEMQSVWVLAALALVALAVGVAVTWWAQRVLSPLPRLQERVEAVSRGDFARHLGPARDDEIGRLARDFERMVAALSARDASLREATERAIQSERLAAVGRMAAHVTHEVRNPLNSMRLNLELLEEEVPGSNAAAKALLSAIHGEIERLTEITGEYLRVARLPNPDFESADLAAAVDAVARFVQPELSAANVELVHTTEPGLPSLVFDEAQFRQALLNVLRNALEAMPAGGRIELRVGRDRTGVAVLVKDYGAGIAPAEQKRIFDPFYTTKKLGTGLGLPLSQQIMAAHGGRLSCRSEPGSGTEFELWLPLAGEDMMKDRGSSTLEAGA